MTSAGRTSAEATDLADGRTPVLDRLGRSVAVWRRAGDSGRAACRSRGCRRATQTSSWRCGRRRRGSSCAAAARSAPSSRSTRTPLRATLPHFRGAPDSSPRTLGLGAEGPRRPDARCSAGRPASDRRFPVRPRSARASGRGPGRRAGAGRSARASGRGPGRRAGAGRSARASGRGPGRRAGAGRSAGRRVGVRGAAPVPVGRRGRRVGVRGAAPVPVGRRGRRVGVRGAAPVPVGRRGRRVGVRGAAPVPVGRRGRRVGVRAPRRSLCAIPPRGGCTLALSTTTLLTAAAGVGPCT